MPRHAATICSALRHRPSHRCPDPRRPAIRPGPRHYLVAVEPDECLNPTIRDAQGVPHLFLREDVQGQPGHVRNLARVHKLRAARDWPISSQPERRVVGGVAAHPMLYRHPCYASSACLVARCAIRWRRPSLEATDEYLQVSICGVRRSGRHTAKAMLGSSYSLHRASTQA